FHSNTSAVWSGFLSAWLFRKKHFWQIMEIIESPRLVSRLMSKVVGKFSDKVFCISDAVKNHFLKFNGDRKNKFITLYHGVDRNIYNMKNIDRDLIRQGLGVDDDVVLIGFAGRYNAWKGQEVLAEAAKYILTTISNSVKIHFLFLGSVYADQHHYEYQLRDILQSNEQIKSHSTMLGFQKDFHNWLGSMDIVVLPSKLPEPNATVIVAAMTLGIPVVGTNIGGTVESVSDGMTGYLVPPNDPQALAVKICDLVNSPEKRLLFGDNSLLRANTMFSIDNYTATVLRSYENVFTL
ncbi:MAG: glycosyltransferase family 4 protein, partial [Desulfuromonadaceae bacterium]|nr:glycosyltransferase family 4 protein [Desulfuromonadaceae bacterium]